MNNSLTPALVNFVGILIIFIAININYFLFFFIYTVLFWVVQIYYTKKVAIHQYELGKVHEKATGAMFESANNLISIKPLGAKKLIKKRVNKQWFKKRKIGHKMQDLSNTKWKWFQIINSFAMLFFLLMMGKDFLSGAITVGSIIIFYSYMDRMRGAMANSTFIYGSLVEAKQGIARMIPIFEQKPEKWFGTKKFPKKWSQILFNNISFKYSIGKKQFKIKNINLKINKNEKIGFVGESGSGKSTVAKLLMGLYKLEMGTFSIDKTNFYDLSHNELTKQVSIVLQDAELFNMSFKDNITLLNKFDKKQFNLAMNIAQLKPILKKLPYGIATFLGEKGYKLSGGERQRIGIARAIYKNPQILILDEATSSLDTQTEKKIQQKLDSKLKNKTIIVITYRLSTLTGVDRIVVFKNGKIVEEGKYNFLSRKKNSLFYALLKSQKNK